MTRSGRAARGEDVEHRHSGWWQAWGLNEHPLKSRLRAVAEVEGNLKSFVISSEAMNIILVVLILLLLLGGGGGFYFGGPMVGGGIGGLLLVILILWLLFGKRR